MERKATVVFARNGYPKSNSRNYTLENLKSMPIIVQYTSSKSE